MSRMTDTELQRRKAICEVAGIKDIGELSDGFHTFNGLYEQRLILFAALVKAYKDKAWKSYRHEDGEYCFGGGWFVVGIDTPEGSYTYHYENKYFDLFDCEILDYAKQWDGHTEKDVTRLLSLLSAQPELGENSPSEQPKMNELWIKTGETCTDAISRQAAIDAIKKSRFLVDAMEKVIKLPSAQPEIVQCKDCKHSEPFYRDKRRCFLWHEEGIDVFDDGFCNYAERRTDERPD